jgi:hypothetical protein
LDALEIGGISARAFPREDRGKKRRGEGRAHPFTIKKGTVAFYLRNLPVLPDAT